MPPHFLAESAADQWRECCPNVHAHIKNGEPTVPASVFLIVEGANEGADVRFEQTGSNDDETKPQKEKRPGRECQAKVARSEDASADEHGTELAEPFVSNE